MDVLLVISAVGILIVMFLVLMFISKLGAVVAKIIHTRFVSRTKKLYNPSRQVKPQIPEQ